MERVDLETHLEEANQGHLLCHLSTLSGEIRESFLEELMALDLSWIEARREQYRKSLKAAPDSVERLVPAPVITLPETGEEWERRAEAERAGEEALRAGRLAAFLVAGGQGTRLGFDGPKGCYAIGPVTGRTLFQWHAEQILARAERYKTVIPWYIMTSQGNDRATRDFFAAHDYFGHNPDHIHFFSQGMVPSVDVEGRLILESPGHLALSPNGHGGSLQALVESGAIADMKRRGVDTISYFQVDNPLTTICDPVFAGYHLLAGAQMSSKVIRKQDPAEKVGVVVVQNGQTGVIEYSDLGEELCKARDDRGNLLYWAGSIAIHMLNVDFVDTVGTQNTLPWHIALKTIPVMGPAGDTVIPDKPNGVKFETFVFDALPLCTSTITLEVDRDEEFAPVKNATGRDSVESCRRLLSARAARMIAEAGDDIALAGVQSSHSPSDWNGETIEISPAFALDAQDLRAKNGGRFPLREGLVLGSL